jgi:hypothetical protein
MTQVFDLDAVAAEAEGAPLEFTFRGEQWSIKHMKSFGRATKRLLANIGSDDDAVDVMLTKGMGEERYRRWQEIDPGIGVEEALLEKWLEHCGMSRGKLPDSTGSSESTEQPSTPAFSPNTDSASPTSSLETSPSEDFTTS